MKKSKGLLLSALSVFCISATVGAFCLSKPMESVAENGGAITVYDDFTKISNIEDANDISATNVYDYHCVSRANNTAEAGWGLMPMESFSSSAITGDGYITYRLSSDDGYVFDGLEIDLSAVVSHSGVAAFIGNDKTNLNVYIATDNLEFTKIYQHVKNNGGGEYVGALTSAQARKDGASKIEIDGSSYVKSASVVYIKIELLQLTYEEIATLLQGQSALNSCTDTEKGLVNRSRVGTSICSVSLKATQTVKNSVKTDVSITDDFSKTKLSDSNAIDYSNVVNYPDGNTVVPAPTWGAYVQSDDGYILYKLTAKESGTLKNISLDLTARVNASGGIFNWWSYNSTGITGRYGKEANIFVDISTDGGENYESVYNVLYDKSLYKRITRVSDGQTFDINPFQIPNYNEDGTTNSSQGTYHTVNPIVDLSAYTGEEIYIKIRIEHPTPAETHSSFVSNGLPMSRTALRIDKVSITAEEESQPTIEEVEIDDTGLYVLEDDFRTLVNGFTEWKQEREYSGVVTYSNGSFYHGLIPSQTWGAEVNASNGYVLYEIPLNGNGLFTNLKTLELSLQYLLLDKNEADLQVFVGYDKENLVQEYSARESLSFGENQTSRVDLSKFLDTETAKISESLFVKIALIHANQTLSLGNLGVKVFKVSFSGKQNFVMDKGASIRKTGKNGMRFTTLIDKQLYNSLLADGYTLTFGSFIMPKDYVEEYGDLTYENLFGENAKYCWGEKVESKTQILHSNANILLDIEKDYHGFRHSIVNILQENLNREFIARGYIKCVKDNQVRYIMAEYPVMDSENVSRSMSYIAQKAIEDTVDTAYINNLQSLYLNDLQNENASYTVIHIYVSATNNISVVKNTYQAEIGTVVSANAQLTYQQNTYQAVSSLSLADTKLETQASGTVYADGSLVLVRIYKAN